MSPELTSYLSVLADMTPREALRRLQDDEVLAIHDGIHIGYLLDALHEHAARAMAMSRWYGRAPSGATVLLAANAAGRISCGCSSMRQACKSCQAAASIATAVPPRRRDEQVRALCSFTEAELSADLRATFLKEELYRRLYEELAGHLTLPQ